MKIPLLTTGATGLVGSRFVELYEAEFEIFNMDLTTKVDITNKSSIEEFVKAHPAKFLIHLAAFTNTTEAFKQNGDKSGLCYQVNVVGTENIASVCRDVDIHLLHISTDFVFDGTKSEPYLENDPKSPIEWYGETKAIAEDKVVESGVSYTIARISYPYRANFALKPDIIAKIRQGLESGTLYPQFTDTTITPTFIDDIARGFAQIIKTQASGIFHLVGSDSMSPYQLAQAVAQAYDFDPSLVQKGSLTEYLAKSPRPFARFATLDNSRVKSELGFTPLTLAEGLKKLKIQQES
jgi:dTDP-4-dehydrorhamnose reductase